MKIDSTALTNNTSVADKAVRMENRPKIEPQLPFSDTSSTQEVKVQIQSQLGQTELKPTDETDAKKIKDAVDHANQTMRHAKTRCEFSYHEETKRVSIKVIDDETDEIIREIPPEETLEMLSKMWELAGIMVDEKR